MYSRLLKKPLEGSKSFFLFGPRGIGKTSWLKRNIKESIYIDLLETDLYTRLLAEPNRLEELIRENYQNWIIIDEVQKIPQLLNEVHRLIEAKKYKFILTGSSARTLRRKGTNLLAGRALTYKMYPLTCEELEEDFDLEKSLSLGHLPQAYTDEDPKKYLESYIKTYVREEVLQEGLTRNLAAFSRFLESASFSQASVLSIAAIARDSGINRKLVESYFEILEDLLIAYRLPVFNKKAKRRLVQHPKFYFFDAGVFRTVRPMGPLDKPEEAEGPALETLVFQELKAINDYYELDYEIYYWRTANNTEVDFVLYGERGIVAIEVKRSSKIDNKDLSGLKSFSRDYPGAKLYLFYGGDREEHRGDINLVPLKDGLRNLKRYLV